MKKNISVVSMMNDVFDSEIEVLRAKGAVSDMGKHWELVDYPPISDMGKHWDLVENEPDDFGGNHTVYQWVAVDMITGQHNIYVGETGRTLKQRFDSGCGYNKQPKAKQAITSAGGWHNVQKNEVLPNIIDRKTAEWYEKQVTKIRKANLGQNDGGRGNAKGAKYNTGHNIIAIKDGQETTYRTITEAVEGTGLSLGTVHNRYRDGLTTKGYKFKRVDC